jgi:predicted dehydrogenase
MYIKEEDKALGRENFHRAITIGNDPRGMSRRDFLIGTLGAAAAGGVGLGAMYFGYGQSVPNPVRVGFIGTGDEGSVLIGAHTPSYVQCVAIADIRPFNIHRAFHGDYASDNTIAVRPGLMNIYDWKTEEEARKLVQVYGDYNDLLDDPNVEAVVIALPLHLHAEAAIRALRKGKHVLTEKLMAQSVAECKEMARVAKETRLYLATGHQRHYSILYDNAIHTIKNGLLGDLHHIRAQWHRNNLPGDDSWQPPIPIAGKGLEKLKRDIDGAKKRVADAEKTKNWADLEKNKKRLAQLQKQLEDQDVQAESFGYIAKELDGGKYKRSALEELIRWRLWERTGGGLMAELGSHQLDASGIFCTAVRPDDDKDEHGDKKKALPLSVNAVGGRHIFPVDRECEDHVYCMYEYPGPKYDAQTAPEKKIVVTYSSINGNGFGHYGELVMGTTRTLALLGETEALLFDNKPGASTRISATRNDSLDTTASGAPGVGRAAIESGPISRGYKEEMEHWGWCIRNPSEENRPRCHPKVALADAVIALTTNIALRNPEHSQIAFKPEWFDPNNDATPEFEYLKDEKYKVNLDREQYKPRGKA